MKPLVVKCWETDFIATPSPYERQRQVLFSSKLQGITSTAIGTVTIPPGGQSDLHSHELSDEFWISTKGHGKVRVDGNEVDIEPGMVICAPAKSMHQIINTGKETLHAYWIMSPAGARRSITQNARQNLVYNLSFLLRADSNYESCASYREGIDKSVSPYTKCLPHHSPWRNVLQTRYILDRLQKPKRQI